MNIELNEQERNLIIDALKLAPINGNAGQVKVVVIQIEELIAKLSPQPDPEPNGSEDKATVGG